jgi:agmatine deiminase
MVAEPIWSEPLPAEQVREFLRRAVRAGETPRALGYRMPAEWSPHRATWLSWPHKEQSWPGLFRGIPELWAELVKALIAAGEHVFILAGGDSVFSEAKALVGDLPQCQLYPIPTDDAWIRDSGPIFLSHPDPQMPPALVDWRFNAWGGKYPPYDQDDAIPFHIARLTGRRRFEVPIVLEGGAVDVNGLGTGIVARGCLLAPSRNPGLTEDDLAAFLREYLAIDHIIWVEGMLEGDDTDGHVDQLARFVNPRTVVVAAEEDSSDPNYEVLQNLKEMLSSACDQEGRPLELVPLPMPRPIFIQGQRVPASYVNFYIANRAVILPAFDDPADRLAAETLARLFPEREVVPLPARQLVWGLGAFHCITQQEPV